MAAENVQFVVSELTPYLLKWRLIDDCLQGQDKVKARGDMYLPRPNAADKSADNKARYESYLARAVFYGVTPRTLNGMVGMVFSRTATIKLPKLLEVLLLDVDGSAVTLEQQAKRALRNVIALGRCGIYTDYPNVDAPVTREQQNEGNIRPNIIVVQPDDVINWRVRTVGARQLLSLVVIRECPMVDDDGFERETTEQYRVLRLTKDNKYKVEIWTSDKEKKLFSRTKEYYPKDSKGDHFTEIPFVFIGAENNDPDLDEPPLYDLAVLNIGHYRNSADYEEACFIVGQPTPYFAGLTSAWVKDVLKGEIQLGSRAAVPLPEHGSAGLLQVTANTMPKEAMEHKERQMVAIGARLVENRKVQQTATEALQNEASESSVVATAAVNVSSAYTDCLKWAAEFVGEKEVDTLYALNTDFVAATMTASDRAELVNEWMAGLITFEEARSVLRRVGTATVDDKKAQADIKANPPPQPKAAAEKTKKPKKPKPGAGGP